MLVHNGIGHQTWNDRFTYHLEVKEEEEESLWEWIFGEICQPQPPRAAENTPDSVGEMMGAGQR